MKINKVLDYYYRAYYKAASGQAEGRSAIGAIKQAVNAGERPRAYQKLKKKLLRLVAGPLYWPNTFPTAIDDAAAAILYCLVRLACPRVVVEIGTAYGNSAIAIGQALEDNSKGVLYTIDPTEQEIVNIAIKKSHLGNRIHYMLGYSYDVIPKLDTQLIDIAFIDGDHSGDNPMNDFRLVTDRIVSGGFLIFHDSIFFDTVKKAVAAAEASGQYDMVTLPTLSGATREWKGALASWGPNFIPAGLTIARKK